MTCNNAPRGLTSTRSNVPRTMSTWKLSSAAATSSATEKLTPANPYKNATSPIDQPATSEMRLNSTATTPNSLSTTRNEPNQRERKRHFVLHLRAQLRTHE